MSSAPCPDEATASAAEPAPPRLRLPGRTTPTWDMELLVSAASVFALLQLPGWMDAAYFDARPRLDVYWDLFARIAWSYGKLGAMVLAGAFALHLCLRAYWIALVGMDSIFPEGVRWDALRLGPRRVRALQAWEEPMAVRIERVDNRASYVFALGLTLAMSMMFVLVLVALCYVLMAGVAWATGWRVLPDGAFWLLAAGAAPLMIAAAVDRRLGARIGEGSRAARAIDAVYAFYARLGFGRGSNPTLLLMQSHEGVGRMMAVTLGAVLVAALLAFGQMLVQRNAPGDAPGHWPAAGVGTADSVVSAHYRDQSPPASSLLPTIDSAFPEGDYLTLVVPFDPKRHPAAFAKACPQAWHAADSPPRRQALRTCAGRWLDLRLDGQPVPAHVRFHDDQRTGLASMLVVMPVGTLAAGGHELALASPPPAWRAREQAARYRIVFWR